MDSSASIPSSVDETLVEEDDLVIRPEQPAPKPTHTPKFSKFGIVFGTVVGIIFGLLATFEATAPFLGAIEAWYYRKKGLTSTVWLTSFGVGFLLGLIPGLNWFVYVINFWVVVYIDRHPKLESITEKVGAVGGKIKGGGPKPNSAISPNAPRPIEHEVSPINIEHEVAAPDLRGAIRPDRPEERQRSVGARPLNALEQVDRDMVDPTLKEEESLFESPTDPFAAGRLAKAEAEEKELRQRSLGVSKTDDNIEERANTGTAFMRRLEKNLTGSEVSSEIPLPNPPDDNIAPFRARSGPGQTIDLKSRNIDREAA